MKVKEKQQKDPYFGPLPSRLRELMRDKRVNQQEVAQAIGKTRQAVSLYCSGTSSPDADTIASMAKFFNVSADYLLGLPEITLEDIGLSEKALQALRYLSGAGDHDQSEDIRENNRLTIDFINRALELAVRDIGSAELEAEYFKEPAQHVATIFSALERYIRSDEIAVIRDIDSIERTAEGKLIITSKAAADLPELEPLTTQKYVFIESLGQVVPVDVSESIRSQHLKDAMQALEQLAEAHKEQLNGAIVDKFGLFPDNKED